VQTSATVLGSARAVRNSVLEQDSGQKAKTDPRNKQLKGIDTVREEGFGSTLARNKEGGRTHQ